MSLMIDVTADQPSLPGRLAVHNLHVIARLPETSQAEAA